MLIFRRKFFLLSILLASVMSLHAQEIELEAFHCLDHTIRAVPLSDVDINGIIFVSSGDGIRAMRNPIPTPYLIAFSDDYRNFGNIGSFSPDGKWYVYPSGTSSRANWFDRHYHLKRLNFINTHTGQRAFYVPVDEYALYMRTAPHIRPVTIRQNWLSNVEYFFDENTVINTASQSQEPYIGTIPVTAINDAVISPDFSRMIVGRNIVDIASGEILLETEHQAEWLGDGTGYYVRSADPDTISAYDLNGNLRFSNGRRFAIVSQTGKWLAGGGNTEQSDSGKIFLLMNTDNGQKVDLCALVKDTAFSPDDKHAIVQTIHDNRGHIWMVDLESWEATPIDVYFDVDSFFVGWWDV